jgi:hypothetical protein
VYLLTDSLEEGEYTLPPGPVFLFPNSVMDALKAEVQYTVIKTIIVIL